MIKIQVDHRAVKDITRKLKNLEPKLRKKALGRAAKAAMKPVLSAVRSAAPRDDGPLRKSIRLRNLKRSRSRVGVTVASKAAWLSDPDSDGFYPAQVEFGWRAGETDVEGQHFMERAFERTGEDAKRKFIEQVPKEIDKIITEAG